MPIGPYFVDFLCRSAALVVELDGFSHEMRQVYDANRTYFLKKSGFCVIRFQNRDVFENIEAVLAAIETALPTPNPSRKREGSKI